MMGLSNLQLVAIIVLAIHFVCLSLIDKVLKKNVVKESVHGRINTIQLLVIISSSMLTGWILFT